jgi:hypothetical protein
MKREGATTKYASERVASVADFLRWNDTNVAICRLCINLVKTQIVAYFS